MALEALAAVVLGLAALFLVLQPVLSRRPIKPPAYEPPDPEETPRGVALAALKEIEFDRETGKLSDSDYELLKSKYTGQALEALRAEDLASAEEETGAGDVEALIALRVRTLRFAATSPPPATLGTTTTCSSCGPRPEADALFCSNCGTRLPLSGMCAGCGAPLGPDSLFCDHCGAAVAA